MNIDIDKLERLAKAATPGPWSKFDKNNVIAVLHAASDRPVINWTGFDRDGTPRKVHRANAAYISAANPATVLELIGEVRRLRAELAAAQAREKVLRKALEECLSWVDAWCDTSPETCFEVVEQEANNALLLPSDDTAMRQAIRSAKEEMRERAAKLFDNGPYVGVLARNIAAAIQSLEVE